MWTCTPPPAGRAAAGQRGVGCKSTFSYLFFRFLGKGSIYYLSIPYHLQKEWFQWIRLEFYTKL